MTTDRELICECAMNLRGCPYMTNFPTKGQHRDCVWFANEALKDAGVDPVSFPENWTCDGGELPLTKIRPSEAMPGDIIAFFMSDWSHFKHHVAIMTYGDGAKDKYAKVCHLYWAHAATECHIGPWWSKYIVGAYRVVP